MGARRQRVSEINGSVATWYGHEATLTTIRKEGNVDAVGRRARYRDFGDL